MRHPNLFKFLFGAAGVATGAVFGLSSLNERVAQIFSVFIDRLLEDPLGPEAVGLIVIVCLYCALMLWASLPTQVIATDSEQSNRPRIGTPGAAIFDIFGPNCRVVIDIKNFGDASGLDLNWQTQTGWFDSPPSFPIAKPFCSRMGVIEPGHSQNLTLIQKSPLTPTHIEKSEREGAGFYALAEITYSDECERTWRRRIAYYLDKQAGRRADRWMLSAYSGLDSEVRVT